MWHARCSCDTQQASCTRSAHAPPLPLLSAGRWSWENSPQSCPTHLRPSPPALCRPLGNATFLSVGFSKTRLLRHLPGALRVLWSAVLLAGGAKHQQPQQRSLRCIRTTPYRSPQPSLLQESWEWLQTLRLTAACIICSHPPAPSSHAGGRTQEFYEWRFTFSVSTLALACVALGALCLALFPCLSREDEDCCCDCGDCECGGCGCGSDACQGSGCEGGEAAGGKGGSSPDHIMAAGYTKL